MNCPVATMKTKAVKYLRNTGSHLCKRVVHKPVFNALPYLLFRIPDYSNSSYLGGGGNFKKS